MKNNQNELKSRFENGHDVRAAIIVDKWVDGQGFSGGQWQVDTTETEERSIAMRIAAGDFTIESFVESIIDDEGLDENDRVTVRIVDYDDDDDFSGLGVAIFEDSAWAVSHDDGQEDE